MEDDCTKLPSNKRAPSPPRLGAQRKFTELSPRNSSNDMSGCGRRIERNGFAMGADNFPYDSLGDESYHTGIIQQNRKSLGSVDACNVNHAGDGVDQLDKVRSPATSPRSDSQHNTKVARIWNIYPSQESVLMHPSSKARSETQKEIKSPRTQKASAEASGTSETTDLRRVQSPDICSVKNRIMNFETTKQNTVAQLSTIAVLRPQKEPAKSTIEKRKMLTRSNSWSSSDTDMRALGSFFRKNHPHSQNAGEPDFLAQKAVPSTSEYGQTFSNLRKLDESFFQALKKSEDAKQPKSANMEKFSEKRLLVKKGSQIQISRISARASARKKLKRNLLNVEGYSPSLIEGDEAIDELLQFFHEKNRPIKLRTAAARVLCQYCFPEEKLKGLCERVFSENGMADLLLFVREHGLRIHKVIDESEILVENPIAQGAAGIVYNGMYKGEKVAIKCFTPFGLYFSEEEFFSEVSIMTMVQGPHLLPCLGAGKRGDELFMVMPRYDGCLATLLAEENLEWRTKLEILIDSTDAIVNLHNYGLVHRDLKPANLLYKLLKSENIHDRSYFIALADFGTSRSTRTEICDKRMTKAVGTTAYMSPEQFEDNYTSAVDIWALGVIIWQSLLQTVPYAGEHIAAVATKIIAKETLPIPPGFPAPLTELLNQCWSPADKRPNALWVKSKLEEYYAQIMLEKYSRKKKKRIEMM